MVNISHASNGLFVGHTHSHRDTENGTLGANRNGDKCNIILVTFYLNSPLLPKDYLFNFAYLLYLFCSLTLIQPVSQFVLSQEFQTSFFFPKEITDLDFNHVCQ